MSTSAIIEGILSLALRLGFFTACRGYVQKILYADLREVVLEDQPDSPIPGGKQGAAHWRKNSQSETSLLPVHANGSPGTPPRRGNTNRAGQSSRQSLYSKLSSVIFCVTFSESCILFTLVLFGSVMEER